MAAMTMDREPEMARFIDTYKFDQDMSNKRDRFGGGTSLPLNSDGYEDKQRALREERHRDWMVQQDKPKDPAVYYRLGTPEQGFPGLGSYQKQRQENNKMRQKEYNSLLRKQKQTEQEKLMNRHRSPPRPAQPQGPQVDYNLQGEQARAEEKRAYQDYMGKYQYNANAPPKPTFDYEENKKILNEERKREYNQLMDKKAKEERYWQMRGRPVTPPGGLNIGAYDKQLKETAAAKKKEYKEMLDQQKFEQHKLRALDRVADVSPKYVSYRENERPLVGSPRDVNYYMQEQQKEHMYLRARQEPEMAVIDRNAPQQYLANKPPPGPGYRPREEPLRQYPAYWNEGRQARGPRSYDSDVSRSDLPVAFKTDPRPIPERPQYGQPPYPGHGQYMPEGDRLNPEAFDRPSYAQQPPPRSPGKQNPDWLKPQDDDRPVEGTPLNEERRRMEEEKHYQQASKPAQVVKNQYYSSDDYEKFQKEIAKEQSKEYQEFLAKAPSSHNTPRKIDGPQGLNIDVGYENRKKAWLEKQRNKDYNEFLKKPNFHEKAPTPPDQQGLPIGQQHYEHMYKAMETQRNREYNEFLQKQKQKHPDRRNDYNGDVSGGPYSGLFQGLGDHGNKSDLLNQERKREYNEQYAGKEKMTGRPNWARETLPNNSDRGRSSPMKSQPPTDQYQQMLDEKRREEAGRRRYDDPEYQGRLAESRERERGEAGPRYGGY